MPKITVLGPSPLSVQSTHLITPNRPINKCHGPARAECIFHLFGGFSRIAWIQRHFKESYFQLGICPFIWTLWPADVVDVHMPLAQGLYLLSLALFCLCFGAARMGRE